MSNLSNTELISLPQEVLVQLLDMLSVPDLLKFLSTNLELKSSLMPFFSEKIEDYQEDLRYREGPVKEITKKRISNLMRFSSRISVLVLVDPILSNFMSINHMPFLRGKTIYSSRLISTWFYLYIMIFTGQCDLENMLVPINDELSELIQVPVGTLIDVEELISLIKERFTQYLFNPYRTNLIGSLVFDTTIIYDKLSEYGISELDQTIIMQSLSEEENELNNILRLIDEKCIEQGLYPTDALKPASLNESIL